MADGSARYTVDEALLAMDFGKFQYLVLLYAGMGWISEAMEMMLLSFVGPAVQHKWGLSSHQESLITSVVFIGMLVGAYSWGMVSDKYGRRWQYHHFIVSSFLFPILFYCNMSLVFFASSFIYFLNSSHVKQHLYMHCFFLLISFNFWSNKKKKILTLNKLF